MLQLLVFRQKLIEVVYALRILVKKLRLARLGLSLLDQIQDHDRSAVALEQVVEMSSSGNIERVHDRNWCEKSDNMFITRKVRSLSIGGLGATPVTSCVQKRGILPRYWT